MKFVRKRETGKDVIIVPNHKVLRRGTLNDILKKIDVRIVDNLKELMK